MRRFLVSLFALAALAVGTGCVGDTDDDASATQDELRALTIGDSDNGKTFNVEKGQSFKVSLGSNPSTGYKWTIVSTDRTLGYPTPRDGSYTGGGAGGPVGGGGTQTFTWKTDGPLLQPSGTPHVVKLEYRRSWENQDTPAAKKFSFKIKIKAAAPPPPPSEPVTVFEEHNNSTVTAVDGQDFVIRLPENPSAGYRWRVVSDGTLADPAKEYVSNNPGRVGGGGTAVFTYKTANKKGSYNISLKYSRGEQGAAAQTFKIKLNVVDADTDQGFECPASHSINCMPPTTTPYCAGDYRSWAQANCDVSYLD